jgi:hypothetical protein
MSHLTSDTLLDICDATALLALKRPSWRCAPCHSFETKQGNSHSHPIFCHVNYLSEMTLKGKLDKQSVVILCDYCVLASKDTAVRLYTTKGIKTCCCIQALIITV